MESESNGALKLALHGIGASARRVEDFRFLRGLGRYTDDLVPGDAAHMFVLRSPHASALILNINVAAAAAQPGVLAVLTARDMNEDGIGRIVSLISRNGRDGRPMPEPPFRPLAVEGVHMVGEPVAIVLATTLSAAQEAAELIEVTYREQPAVVDAAEALRDGAALVWAGHSPTNECFYFERGDRKATDAAFERAAHVCRLDYRITRVSANPMEPRNAIGMWDGADGTYTLISGVQMPHTVREELASTLLNVPAHQIRVISPDMGGSFGLRGNVTVEHALVLWAARRIGRPVRWTATRSESFVSDFHSRDNVSTAKLALDRDGIFLGLRVSTQANLGAYIGSTTVHSSTNNLGSLAGTYRTPHIHVEVSGAFTNTHSNVPYRGAGRPEAIFAIERIIDVAAAEMGIDRVEIRRRNLIATESMPFKTGLVFTYDCGDFEKNLDLALNAADWAGFPHRRETVRSKGLWRGIGVVNAIEVAGGGAPMNRPLDEHAELRFDPTGAATVVVGTHSHGQGHETVYRQLVATFLGLRPDQVRFVQGDTAMVAHGRGTFGSRSLTAGGTALRRAADKIIDKGIQIAAHLLEASDRDIQFENGRFVVGGTDRSITLTDIARASYDIDKRPPGMEYGLAARSDVSTDNVCFPNGCHVCEVEIDGETGETRIVNYTVVDDVGTLINPMLVKGQIHGGVVQGIGQALLESVVYDAGGQLITGSFMDYAMPRASHLSDISVLSNPVPTKNNALGAKGAGEAGCVGSLVAVVNAIVNALSPFGVRHVEMPCTPYRIWAAMNSRPP
jgi:carbon-monoxide dehydrogenase large subunit